MSPNSWLSGDDALAGGYAAHGRTLRGVIRHAVVHEALTAYLPAPKAVGGARRRLRILDIGGGDGVQARMLAALGHCVTVLDPDSEMLARGDMALADRALRSRITFVEGPGERAIELVGGRWDVVCCHGVLMYVDDERALLTQVVAAARNGGVISVLAKNAHALPLRPALEGRWREAIDMLRGGDAEIGNLGVPSRGHRLAELTAALADAGAQVTEWHGVRVATDHLGDTLPGSDVDEAICLEWELGRRDPYRACGRLLHVIARKESPADEPSNGSGIDG